MKLAILITCFGFAAFAQSAQEQAAILTKPATEAGLKNNGTMKMLEQLEKEERAAGSSDQSATPSAIAQPIREEKTISPAEPRKTHFESHARTTRFLFLRIADSLLRFHVDANLGDEELEVIVHALGTSCLKTQLTDVACDQMQQNTILVDRAFLADAKLSQSSVWSREETPKGQLWKLVCASGEDDCFARNQKIRSFRLTTNRTVQMGRILAHGFESQSIKALAKKRRAPASPQKTFDRVYVTRTTSEKIKLLPKGTL